MNAAEAPTPAPSPPHLLIVAGRGAYPLELARGARAEGVQRISVIAFRGETSRAIAREADDVHWLPLGSIQRFFDTVRELGASEAVLAGQIAPRNLFTLRLDRRALELLRSLRERNAHTIFGAIVRELEALGPRVRPAHLYMRAAMPDPGVLTARAPDARELADLQLGRSVAYAVSGLDIGQTVVIKNGTILAVEAFEGTDQAILRAGRLGGPGAVVIKTAKDGHDMRFDIPVIGRRTLRSMRRARATALAMEAGRAILLEREAVIAEADARGISLIACAPLENQP
jgi:UDP-2,3-diacylglucosamine hydrolase